VSQANLFARLVGALFVDAKDRSLPPGQLDLSIRTLWHEAAGDMPPEGGSSQALPLLDAAGLDRLRDLIATRFSPGMADKLLADRRHGYLRAQAPDRGQSGVSAPAGQDRLLQELLNETAGKLSILPDKPEETAETTLRALWQAAAGTPVSTEQATEMPLPVLDEAAVTRLRGLMDERFSGIPLAHLTGRQRFMGIELMTSKAALVPRKETELLGSASVAMLQQIAEGQGAVTVIDVCTGAGNLALALATYEPKARVYASDLSVEAVELARHNGEMLSLGDRVEFRQGDFLEPFADGHFDHRVDLLVCNPPYISSGKVGTMPSEIISHEPALAFDGGPFGVKILQRLISEAPRYLRRGGWLGFEVGLGQGKAIMDRLRRNQDYADLAGVVDTTGAIRAVVARVT